MAKKYYFAETYEADTCDLTKEDAEIVVTAESKEDAIVKAVDMLPTINHSFPFNKHHVTYTLGECNVYYDYKHNRHEDRVYGPLYHISAGFLCCGFDIVAEEEENTEIKDDYNNYGSCPDPYGSPDGICHGGEWTSCCGCPYNPQNN